MRESGNSRGNVRRKSKNQPNEQPEGERIVMSGSDKKKFAVTFEGLVELIKTTYSSISTNRYFAKRVSLSMYSYYIWQHLYARIAEIVRISSSIESDDKFRYI